MTEEEKQALIEKINTYWTTPHPDENEAAPKPALIPVYAFDRIPDDFMPDESVQTRQSQWFQTDEHVNAVREKYNEIMDYVPPTETEHAS